MKFFENTN